MEQVGVTTQMMDPQGHRKSGLLKRPWPSHAAGAYFVWKLHEEVRQCQNGDRFDL